MSSISSSTARTSTTAVMVAASCGHRDIFIFKYLHQAGADINVRDNDGWTAVVGAALGGNKDIIKYLYQPGADLNTRDNAGVTAVRGAAAWGHGAVVKYLHQAGADWRTYSQYSRTLWTGGPVSKTRHRSSSLGPWHGSNDTEKLQLLQTCQPL